MQSITPECTHSGLGSFHFARRYFGNRVFFLFLRVLRCFSSPGSPHAPMYSVHADGGLLRRVSPFRYLRINGYLLLPEAFRSLLRLSSALSAKASTLRSLLLDHHKECSVTAVGLGFYQVHGFRYLKTSKFKMKLKNQIPLRLVITSR